MEDKVGSEIFSEGIDGSQVSEISLDDAMAVIGKLSETFLRYLILCEACI